MVQFGSFFSNVYVYEIHQRSETIETQSPPLYILCVGFNLEPHPVFIYNGINRKSRRIPSFFDVVKCKNSISLNCCIFGCCQVQKRVACVADRISSRNKVIFFKANQLIRNPPCDSYATCQESRGRGLLQLVKRKNFCPGVVCCLGRAASQSPHWSQ